MYLYISLLLIFFYIYIFSLVVNVDEFLEHVNDMQKECDFKYAQQFEVILSLDLLYACQIYVWM